MMGTGYLRAVNLKYPVPLSIAVQCHHDVIKQDPVAVVSTVTKEDEMDHVGFGVGGESGVVFFPVAIAGAANAFVNSPVVFLKGLFRILLTDPEEFIELQDADAGRGAFGQLSFQLEAEPVTGVRLDGKW